MAAFAPDAGDDSCSICLEPFSTDDPAMVTNCKHEYHLQCILEWSQRSRECPICARALALSDPTSQELLAAMEVKGGRRTRRRPSDLPVMSFTEDIDFDDHIVQHLAAADVTGGHPFNRRERHHRSAAMDHSQLLIFANSSHDSDLQQIRTDSLNETQVLGASSQLPVHCPCTPTTPVIIDELSLGSSFPSSGNLGSDVADNSHSSFQFRVLSSQGTPGSPQRPQQSEIVSFSESLKSKVAAASSRYKESISKSTRGFKEKLLARNSSVKELSKEVQREVTAGIAGVARLMERLDLTSKRSGGISTLSSGSEGTSKLSCTRNIEGESLITQAPDDRTETMASVIGSHQPDSCSFTGLADDIRYADHAGRKEHS
uniref:RING-type E3 ubiquitin transferase n=1 Tax=Anthurium amnicola TaxID=1678845 RepID=A0A1D1YV23_9ARAE